MLDKKNEAFEQFLDFITYFCTELAAGMSPEYALVRSVRQYGKQSPIAFAKAIRMIERGDSSFMAAWRNIIHSFDEDRYQRIVELLGRFMERGSKIGGERMLELLRQIRVNLTLANKRRNIVRAQRMKVTILSVIASSVLGMTAGVLPIIALALQDPFWLAQPYNCITNFMHTPYLTVMLLLVSIVSSYRLSQVTGTSLRLVVACLLISVMTYMITMSLLVSIP